MKMKPVKKKKRKEKLCDADTRVLENLPHFKLVR